MASYEEYFQPWELKIAKGMVGKFLQKYLQLSWNEFEDILQECLSHWVSVKGQYDPQRGASMETFMGNVIRKKLMQIWRDMESDKRKVSHLMVSLNEPLCQEEDSATHLDQLSDQPGEKGETQNEQACLKIDLAKTLCRLLPRQQELCTYLSDENTSIQEISQKMGIPRTTVYDEIKRIRKFFYDEGLEEYLKKSKNAPDSF